jgi:hypothetical protein
MIKDRLVDPIHQALSLGPLVVTGGVAPFGSVSFGARSLSHDHLGVTAEPEPGEVS